MSSARAETGVMQFGDDWPGYFIRGDNVIHIRFVLKGLSDDPPEGIGVLEWAQFRAALEDMTRCLHNDNPEQKLKDWKDVVAGVE